MKNGNRWPKISGGMATTPCGASRVPSMWALPLLSSSASWASTPEGRPRSLPIAKTCRLRTPPPTPITSLCFSRAAAMARTSG